MSEASFNIAALRKRTSRKPAMSVKGSRSAAITGGGGAGGPLRGLGEQLLPACEPEPPIGAPVDRHGDAGAEQRQRLRRALRIEMPFGKARAPTGDGQQRDVEVGRDAAHPVEQVR